MVGRSKKRRSVKKKRTRSNRKRISGGDGATALMTHFQSDLNLQHLDNPLVLSTPKLQKQADQKQADQKQAEQEQKQAEQEQKQAEQEQKQAEQKQAEQKQAKQEWERKEVEKMLGLKKIRSRNKNKVSKLTNEKTIDQLVDKLQARLDKQIENKYKPSEDRALKSINNFKLFVKNLANNNKDTPPLIQSLNKYLLHTIHSVLQWLPGKKSKQGGKKTIRKKKKSNLKRKKTIRKKANRNVNNIAKNTSNKNTSKNVKKISNNLAGGGEEKEIEMEGGTASTDEIIEFKKFIEEIKKWSEENIDVSGGCYSVKDNDCYLSYNKLCNERKKTIWNLDGRIPMGEPDIGASQSIALNFMPVVQRISRIYWVVKWLIILAYFYWYYWGTLGASIGSHALKNKGAAKATGKLPNTPTPGVSGRMSNQPSLSGEPYNAQEAVKSAVEGQTTIGWALGVGSAEVDAPSAVRGILYRKYSELMGEPGEMSMLQSAFWYLLSTMQNILSMFIDVILSSVPWHKGLDKTLTEDLSADALSTLLNSLTFGLLGKQSSNMFVYITRKFFAVFCSVFSNYVFEKAAILYIKNFTLETIGNSARNILGSIPGIPNLLSDESTWISGSDKAIFGRRVVIETMFQGLREHWQTFSSVVKTSLARAGFDLFSIGAQLMLGFAGLVALPTVALPAVSAMSLFAYSMYLTGWSFGGQLTMTEINFVDSLVDWFVNHAISLLPSFWRWLKDKFDVEYWEKKVEEGLFGSSTGRLPNLTATQFAMERWNQAALEIAKILIWVESWVWEIINIPRSMGLGLIFCNRIAVSEVEIDEVFKAMIPETEDDINFEDLNEDVQSSKFVTWWQNDAIKIDPNFCDAQLVYFILKNITTVLPQLLSNNMAGDTATYIDAEKILKLRFQMGEFFLLLEIDFNKSYSKTNGNSLEQLEKICKRFNKSTKLQGNYYKWFNEQYIGYKMIMSDDDHIEGASQREAAEADKEAQRANAALLAEEQMRQAGLLARYIDDARKGRPTPKPASKVSPSASVPTSRVLETVGNNSSFSTTTLRKAVPGPPPVQRHGPPPGTQRDMPSKLPPSLPSDPAGGAGGINTKDGDFFKSQMTDAGVNSFHELGWTFKTQTNEHAPADANGEEIINVGLDYPEQFYVELKKKKNTQFNRVKIMAFFAHYKELIEKGPETSWPMFFTGGRTIMGRLIKVEGNKERRALKEDSTILQRKIDDEIKQDLNYFSEAVRGVRGQVRPQEGGIGESKKKNYKRSHIKKFTRNKLKKNKKNKKNKKKNTRKNMIRKIIKGGEGEGMFLKSICESLGIENKCDSFKEIESIIFSWFKKDLTDQVTPLDENSSEKNEEIQELLKTIENSVDLSRITQDKKDALETTLDNIKKSLNKAEGTTITEKLNNIIDNLNIKGCRTDTDFKIGPQSSDEVSNKLKSLIPNENILEYILGEKNYDENNDDEVKMEMFKAENNLFKIFFFIEKWPEVESDTSWPVVLSATSNTKGGGGEEDEDEEDEEEFKDPEALDEEGMKCMKASELLTYINFMVDLHPRME